MGLFGGNKKLCPICGNPAARLLSTKVEGQPLCSECADKTTALPDALRKGCLATMGTLQTYLADYDKNQVLRNTFQESYQYRFGLLTGILSLDVPHRLLRLDASDRAFALEPQNIQRFRILEDGSLLFEGTKNGLICYQSTVPDQVRNMGPEIDRFQRDQMQFEQMKRIEEKMDQQAKHGDESHSRPYVPAPDINQLRPFQKFYLVIEVDFPYSKGNVEFQKDGPSFSGPDFFGGYSSAIKDYLRNYESQAGEMRELATQLMAILNPNAPQQQVGSQAAAGIQTSQVISTASVDSVAEIQRYKSLLDSGIITEEEFAAKKRQLMGI